MAEFTKEYKTDEWEVETPTGWQSFSGIGKTVPYAIWELKTTTSELKCADNHIVYRINTHTNTTEEIFVKDLVIGNVIQSKHGYEVVTSVLEADEEVPMYDLTDVDGGNVYYTNDILSHNSTTVTSYILHHILFNQNMSVAILANKLTTARELLGRLKMAYEFLPMWLQQGVIEWNKGSIVLENGSKVLASATSSSAIRGGSFNCIAGESIVTIRDPKMGGIFNISIEELYANSSRNNQNDIYQYGNDRKQIQEVVFFPYGEGSKSCHGRRDFHGEASHSSKIAWRRQQHLQHCGADNTRTSISTSTSTALLEWDGEGEDVSCIPYDGDGETGTTSKIAINCYIGIEEKLFRGKKINANWNETFRGNEKENVLLTQGSQEFGRDSSENIKGKQRSFLGIDSTKGIWGTSVQTVHGNKEDQRTLGQNQQESRENSKDGREASWNETISRSKGENEIGGSSKNRATGWCLEQGNEDGRWQVLTHNGFKKFHGISKAPTQKTIKVTFDNDQEMVCTPDHKIFSVNRGSVVAESLCVGELVEGDGISVEVVGVEEYGVRNVYDLLEVEEHHSYYANGIRIANCILLDEFAYVPQNVAEEFFSSVYPTVTSGKTTKVVMTSTPNGLNMFYKLWVNANKQIGEEGKNEYFPIEVSWRDIPGRDEAWKLQTIANTSKQQFNTEFESVSEESYVNVLCADIYKGGKDMTIGELYEELKSKNKICDDNKD